MTDKSKHKTDFVARIGNWDNFLAALTILVIVYAIFEVPNFASTFNISQAVAGISERALIVLPMVFLIIAREIDLSVGSTLALTSVVFGLLTQAEFPMYVAIPLTLLAGAACGAFNGVLVTALGLPSLVVTLGTMALFRGIGYILLGSGSINDFPDSFLDFGINTVGDSPVPWTIIPFIVLAPLFAIALQKCRLDAESMPSAGARRLPLLRNSAVAHRARSVHHLWCRLRGGRHGLCSAPCQRPRQQCSRHRA